MIKIVADQAIPLLEPLFGPVAHIEYFPGHQISRAHLIDANALFVRSVTQVNQDLLHNTAIQFVGTMTAGFDHLDTHWLDRHHIKWATAQGANARAVAEYVISCIAYLQQQQKLPQKMRVGIIGVGNTGGQLAQLLRAMDAEVIYCDPLRASCESNFNSTPLTHFTDLDLISLHVPLQRTGSYPTYHLIDKNFLIQQKKQAVLINTSRGEVLNSADLFATEILFCLDVWENEPNINLDLLSRVEIATPHIAGYSWQAKLIATIKIYQAAKDFFEWEDQFNLQKIMQQSLPSAPMLSDCRSWQEVVLSTYNPSIESQQFKNKFLAHSMDVVEQFELLRRYYCLRLEFGTFTPSACQLSEKDKKILQILGFKMT